MHVLKIRCDEYCRNRTLVVTRQVLRPQGRRPHRTWEPGSQLPARGIALGARVPFYPRPRASKYKHCRILQQSTVVLEIKLSRFFNKRLGLAWLYSKSKTCMIYPSRIGLIDKLVDYHCTYLTVVVVHWYHYHSTVCTLHAWIRPRPH